MILFRVMVGVLAVGGALMLLFVMSLAVPLPNQPSTQFGVSFSAPHARGIGLPWQEVYRAILDDLGVKRLRLGAYWNEIERQDDEFDFTDLDYQLDEAAGVGASVILTVGRKVQRWPECHEPQWVRDTLEIEKQQEILEVIEVVVERYRQHPALRMWQLENEPLLDFGDCPPADRAFLAQEEALIQRLDGVHPVLVTDSGELNWWWDASAYGDMLGATMYRTVFSGRTERLFSYDYIFPAWLYRAKGRFVRIVRGKDVIISELQGEPWGAKPFTEMSYEERRESLSPDRLRVLRRFAERTQLPEAYWWGVEYWYWESRFNENPIYWQIAQEFFSRNR